PPPSAPYLDPVNDRSGELSPRSPVHSPFGAPSSRFSCCTSCHCFGVSTGALCGPAHTPSPLSNVNCPVPSGRLVGLGGITESLPRKNASSDCHSALIWSVIVGASPAAAPTP